MSAIDRGAAASPKAAQAIPFALEHTERTKIQASHRDRLAVVYVRQSTQRQVVEHVESTALQYQLARRAVALGWPEERVLVIDDDLGQSARTAASRAGFQHLLAELGLNHVGLVLGIEMSRLARSCKDWYQLLELCALFGSLLADQDGIYDPSDYNDRLLLGLKGTMSEAELHIMRNRLEHGKLHKAQRGELFMRVPPGYLLRPSGELALDPDEQVQAVIRLIFDKFFELGSARAVTLYLRQHKIHMPLRSNNGRHPGPLVWRPVGEHSVCRILNHPMYAGAYVYGRQPVDQQRKQSGQSRSGRIMRPMEKWPVLLRDHLPAYITWEQYLANRKQLGENRSRWHTLGPPRGGAALLAGLLHCQRCGYRRQVHYRKTGGACYGCYQRDRQPESDHCPSLVAQTVDALVSRQVLRALDSAALDLSLQAQQDIALERERLHRHWHQQIERARYQTERARRQYDAVEPENRLVARELESQWNKSLTAQRQLEEEYARFQRGLPQGLSSRERDAIQSLAQNLPQLWDAPTTTATDRQIVVRQLVERVVVDVDRKTELVGVAIHWKGGFISHHEIRRTVRRYSQLQDYDVLLRRVVELRESGHSAPQIAVHLNTEGFRTARTSGDFDAQSVRTLLSRQGLTKSGGALSFSDGCGPDEWWLSDLAKELGMSITGLHGWVKRGWVHARHLPTGCRYWILWADRDELNRLRQLRDQRVTPFPEQLTKPKPRPQNGTHSKQRNRSGSTRPI